MMYDLYHVFSIAPDLPVRAKEYKHFSDAHSTALYMWGKSAGRYLIYKNGRLVVTAHLFPNVEELERHLEGWQPPDAA